MSFQLDFLVKVKVFDFSPNQSILLSARTGGQGERVWAKWSLAFSPV